MKFIAFTITFGVVSLVILRALHVTTDFPSLDRWVSLLMNSLGLSS